ncbi:Ubiquitin-conjugating enzyme E2 [Trinorchestia longiramus]|nr:Ubiquitin-conjugating enzyme E2 [Trinorchestia longiramus]
MASNALPRMVTTRLNKELQRFNSRPPVGITLNQRLDQLHIVDASISGEEGSPFEGGVFKLLITLNKHYPFEPPKVKFITPVYHPNIDHNGLICLDILKSEPSGKWRAVHNLETVVTSIRLLLSSPNPSDPLQPEIASEYLYNRSVYESKARQWTKKYAIASSS